MFNGRTINKQKLEQRSSYGVDDPVSESRQDKRFFLLQNVLSGFGSHPASYSIGTGVLSLGRLVDHSPPPIAKLKKELSCTSTSLICFHTVNRNHFTFYLLIILELRTDVVSDCPLTHSGKCHCSRSDQSSVASNRDRNQKFESATHDPHVIDHGKHIILICTKWTSATFFNSFVFHNSIFGKLYHFTIST